MGVYVLYLSTPRAWEDVLDKGGDDRLPRNSHSHLSLSLSTMSRFLTLVSLLHLAIPALTSPCATFDINFDLLVFGLDGKDWNAGPQSSWTSGGYIRGNAPISLN